MNELKYQTAIDILTSQGKFYINLGLERVQEFLKILDNPEKKLRYIHVAGTNGKGSVCAMLSSILGQATEAKCKMQSAKCVPNLDNSNFLATCHCEERGTSDAAIQNKTSSSLTRIGLFTSPHVFEYTERIKINNVDIDKETFAAEVIKIVDLAQKHNIHLTEFEILTVVAFDYFAQNEVDIVVLETGLGGRFDATNVITENICSIITHIDLDHTERLGDRIEKIAFEKAGIIKQNCPVVVSEKNSGFKTIAARANELGSQIFCAEEVSDFLLNNLALKGSYQAENLALALKAVEIINIRFKPLQKVDSSALFQISEEQIVGGLKNIKHLCRFEYLKDENIIIDGAHNPNGTKALRESLDNYFKGQKIKFIFGCLKNKKYPEMMQNLFTQNDEIYFYHFDNPNSCTCQELSVACEFPSKTFDKFTKDNTLTVICGSFYMLKELLSNMGIK